MSAYWAFVTGLAVQYVMMVALAVWADRRRRSRAIVRLNLRGGYIVIPREIERVEVVYGPPFDGLIDVYPAGTEPPE